MSKQGRETNRQARAAAIQREQANRERRRNILITVVVLVVLAVVVVAGVLFSGRSDSSSAKESGSLPAATATGNSLLVGSNNQAKYKVIVYEDFLCPYCRQFETSSRNFLHAAAKKGTVQVDYRPFHLLQDDYSARALSAWGSVQQQGTPEQALRYHDLLYDNQPYEADPNKPDGDKLAEWAKDSGVTSSSVLDSVKKVDADFVNATDKTAAAAKVQGTPTVLVNGKQLQGSVSDIVDQLKQLTSG